MNQLQLLGVEGHRLRKAVDAPLLPAQLKRIARRYMRDQRQEHTLQATALVNEAYLRLVDVQQINWQNRAHFLAMAARLMRRVLVDSARARAYQKRGGDAIRVTFEEDLPLVHKDAGVLALEEALRSLAALDERKARVVELRFFGGLTVEETAAALDISSETVMRDWKFAKSWLMRELKK